MYGMKVCVVTGAADRLPECDVALFGFERLGDVDYGDELSGKSEKLEEAARLSRTHGCCAVCGCTTYSRGAVRRSAAVAERGKLLGICDMTRVFGGEKYKSGADMGLFFTRGGRVGVCIENDIYFPECISSLATCGCDAVVAIMEQAKDGIPPLLARAYAYLYGVPVVMCAGRTAFFASSDGCLATSTRPVTLFETDGKKGCRLVTLRLKGAGEDGRIDY